MTADNWAATPTARNLYAGTCAACSKPVTEKTGWLAATCGNGVGRPTLFRPVHSGCASKLPERYMWHGGSRVIYDVATFDKINGRWVRMDSSAQEAQPASQPAEPAPDATTLERTAKQLLDDTTKAFMEAVPPLVRATMIEATRSVEIKVAAPKVKHDSAHKALTDVVMCVVAGTHPFLVGPAGSGKTTLAQQVADTLGRKFYAENRVTSEFKLLGYMDATGKYVRTQFREAFEKGGGFLLDEVDASDPDVLTTFNSALANGMCPFPDKMVKAHKDFFAIAAGNTFGRGADRQYVGRNQLDAATLDRFVVLEIDYDEQAEASWAGDADWTAYVQKVRAAVDAEKVRHIVSPRASIYGARLLAAGMEREAVMERVIWKGLDATNRSRVEAAMGVR